MTLAVVYRWAVLCTFRWTIIPIQWNSVEFWNGIFFQNFLPLLLLSWCFLIKWADTTIIIMEVSFIIFISLHHPVSCCGLITRTPRPEFRLRGGGYFAHKKLNHTTNFSWVQVPIITGISRQLIPQVARGRLTIASSVAGYLNYYRKVT